MTIQEAIEEFLLASAADGLRRKTIIWYESILKRYRNARPMTDATQETTHKIREYLVELRSAEYSEDTISAHTRALHRFWDWYSNEVGIPNPMRNIRYPKQPSPDIPKGISPDDVIKLLEACGDDYLGDRDRAIVSFLADTGCRAAGVCGLLIDNVDLTTGTAYVIEKGEKQRALHFFETTTQLLRVWYRSRRQELDTVFHNYKGQPLTPSGLLQLLTRLKAEAGVTGRTNPHAFRHGFAREYLRNGGDLATLARILGHEDVSTTAKFYGIFASDEVKQAHRRHSGLLKTKPLSDSEENDSD